MVVIAASLAGGAPPNFEGKTFLGGNTHCYFVVINNGSALGHAARPKTWEAAHRRRSGTPV
jgi:hypothetical protein